MEITLLESQKFQCLCILSKTEGRRKMVKKAIVAAKVIKVSTS